MIKLYSYYRSSSSYRVRIALNLKNLDYDIVPVNLIKEGGEQFSTDFKKINPAAKIPVLNHDGTIIAQSVAIIEYLDETFPEIPLYPKDTAQKARARQLCEIINSDIQPLQNLSVLKKLVAEYSVSEEQRDDWIRHWITLGFQSFESLIAKTAKRFCLGDTPSAVDCYLIPQIYNALRYHMDLSQFPHIDRVHREAEKLEAFVAAHPDNQPDTP